ncbi:MAG: hypothetical protein P1V35_13345 [Planctomycetota bacterium]|nr:hypothetical protein [Planctomycetota bacterium]
MQAVRNRHILVECEAWGYGRGSQSKGRMRVLDPHRKVVAEVLLGGPSLHQAMLSFVAEERGDYTLELKATEGTFRYVLIRHDGYDAITPEHVRNLDRALSAHGWLPAFEYRQAYTVRGHPGQRILVHAEPTHERGREFKRKWWFRRPLSAAHTPTALVESVVATSRTRGEKAYPFFVVGLPGEAIQEGEHSRVFVLPESGIQSFWVSQHGTPEAGLFDLSIERDLDWRPLQLHLADRNDQPLDDVSVVFLQEPQMARIGQAVTDRNGRAALILPNAPCTLVLHSKLKSRIIRLRTGQENLYCVW